MSITLPKLPAPTLIADSPAGHTAAYSPAQLRARDIEVARFVLEGAAKVCDKAASAANIAWCISGTSEDFDLYSALAKIGEEIRALEVSHAK